jgi:NAD(P)-dependent dehydrogenase (short-subunit alcohol dehydrogenase family)
MVSAGKNIVITGITSGLGLGLAKEFLRLGHRIHGCGRRPDPLAKEMGYEWADRYSYRQLDICDRSALKDWARDIESGGNQIDYLIQNAAVIHPNARLWEIDQKALESVLDVNVRGTFNVLRAFLPQMLAHQHGMILTLSSGAGRAGLPEISGYCASKWAVEGLTKSLAAELPGEMAAIPLSPGIVDTDMLRSTFGERAADHQKVDQWAKVAADYMLGLKTSQSGESLTVPHS